MGDVRNVVLKDFQGESDFVKSAPLFIEWKQLKKEDAPVRALVDICSGESTCGDPRHTYTHIL